MFAPVYSEKGILSQLVIFETGIVTVVTRHVTHSSL